MSAQLEVLPVPTGTTITSLLPVLAEVLNGNRNPQLPVPAHDEREIHRLTTALQPGKPIADQVALVVSTSGTTGTIRVKLHRIHPHRKPNHHKHATVPTPCQ